MPAANYIEIYKQCRVFEDAVKGIIAAAIDPVGTISGLDSFKIVVTRDNTTQETPLVRIHFEIGAQQSHWYQGADLAYRADAWECSLKLGVVTDRRENDDQHELLVGLVRSIFSQWQNKFTTTNLPLHEVRQMMEESVSSEIIAESDLDATMIQYKILLAVRSTAWPA